MKIGITGATGFLGKHATHRLLGQGHQVAAWCRDIDAIKTDDSIQWIQGRLGDDRATQALVKDCDAIVHAGLYQPGSSFVGGEGDPVAYLETNIIGSLKLLEAAFQHGVDRFIFVSTGAVHDRVAEDRPLDEKHPLWPSSFYGAYKASVETLVHTYGFSGMLSCCTLRPTSIYGAAEPIEDSKWYDMISDVAAGKDVQATGGSKSVHVSDVAAAIDLLLQTDQPVRGETFNCTDRMISHFEVAQIAKAVSGSSSVISGQPKEAKRTMDTSKIEALGMKFGGTAILESTIRQILGLGQDS
ncbi:dTDP-glucose 4,6-dehydratase [Rubripirellula obstinata]|uniref:dTDP-glucose 4,6-dehydratase n=1 Tax=Rubripirellula obstinata TaxID=406547 RepID=A0A5B1CMK5_9BACT|nr:SDR family oxidoreductase [Rubripirellula obstinata]KAA1260583.1 dTDP-glucose 4,6-dehydratase [Rubripirellula obstinata]